MSDMMGGKFVGRARELRDNDTRTLGGSALTKSEFEALRAEYEKLNGLAQARVVWDLGTEHKPLVDALVRGKDYQWFMENGGREDGQVQDYCPPLEKCH